MLVVIALVVALAGGIALGRVKNVKKLAAAHAELNSLEAKATADAKSVIAAIRAKL